MTNKKQPRWNEAELRTYRFADDDDDDEARIYETEESLAARGVTTTTAAAGEKEIWQVWMALRMGEATRSSSCSSVIIIILL
jgi:hypothetical protein